VWTQRHGAQKPTTADFQGRRRSRRQVVNDGQLSVSAATAAAALCTRPIRGQRLPAQGAV